MPLTPNKQMMTILTNQEEKFCKVFASTRNGIIAFSQAYPEYKDPKIHRAEAAKLLRRSEISARIDDLVAAVEEPYQYTFEEHLMELRRIRELAIQRGLMRVALEAEQLRGELLGFHNEIIATKKGGASSQHLHLHNDRVNENKRGPTTDDARAVAVLELLKQGIVDIDA